MTSLQSNTNLISHKIGLLNLAEALGNVAKACRMIGVSRDTFYRYQQAKDEGGIDALFAKSRKKPNLRNRVAPELEKEIIDLAIEEPAWGKYERATSSAGGGGPNIPRRSSLRLAKKRTRKHEITFAKA